VALVISRPERQKNWATPLGARLC